MKNWMLLLTLLISLPLFATGGDAKSENLDPSNGLGNTLYKEKKTTVRKTSEGTGGVSQESKKKTGSIMNPGGEASGETGWQGQ